MMWELQACTVCFSTSVKLYNLGIGTLRNDFNSLTGLQMVEGNGLPQFLCVECTAHINKFIKFRKKCHRAHYALKQILDQTEEIKLCHLKSINRDLLQISPSLSFLKEERSKNYNLQFKMVSFMRKGYSEPPGLIPVSHCVISQHDDIMDLDMKATRDGEFEPRVKTEQGNLTETNEIEQDHNQMEPNKQIITNDMQLLNKNGEVCELKVNSIIKQALDMISDGEFENNESHCMDSGDENGFESSSCVLNNESDGVKPIEVYGDVVPITLKEAKAAYEVYKYCSQGKIKCYCGKSCNSEKVYEIHAKQHNMHLSGSYHCEICDIYFKTELLREMHMSDKHMFKYLCKLCPEVTFTKRAAKNHYMNHIDPTSVKKEGNSKKTVKRMIMLDRQKTRKSIPKKKKKKSVPDDFLLYSPQCLVEQYALVQARKESRNYLEAKFRCEQCYRGFRMTLTYNKHMAKHDSTISGAHQCDVCKQYFRSTRVLYKHMIMYHTRKYTCQHCQFFTTNKGQAWNHYKWHKNVTYDCPHCDKKFNKISTQLTHIRFKHPGTDVCSMCGHSFVSSSGLNCHRLNAHSKEERDAIEALALKPDTTSALYCKDCHMQFASEQAYYTHLGSSKIHVDTNISSRSMMSNIRRMSRAEGGTPSNPGKAQLVPPIGVAKGSGRGRKAAEGLPGSSVLNTGATTATNCDVCGVHLASDVLARRHYDAEHPGTDFLKRYMCDICGHTTKQYANLLVHMRTHTREKPYECPFCDRRFSMTSNRDRHLVVHTGEKRYQCQHCSRRFTQSTAVKLHIQTVHMKIPYKPWEKNNRKRRKDAQIKTAGLEVAEMPASATSTIINTAVIPVPQHKLLIGDPQGEYITYISFAQEQ